MMWHRWRLLVRLLPMRRFWGWVFWGPLGGLFSRDFEVFWGPSWCPFGHFWGLLGASSGLLGTSLGPLGASWGVLGTSWGSLEAESSIFENLVFLLGRSWGLLGALLGSLGRLLGRLGALSGCLGAFFGASLAVLERSSGPLGPSWSVGKPKKPEGKKYRKKQMKLNDFGSSGPSWEVCWRLLGAS